MNQGHIARGPLPLLLLLAATCLGGARTDGTLGPKQSFTGHFTVPATAGQQRGGNLFHSFTTFDLATGESATFTGPPSIHNVLVRVTGGTATSIDGTLACSIPNADLYLLNPAGVAFGPGASLDVKGSFAVSTAGALSLGNRGNGTGSSITSPFGSPRSGKSSGSIAPLGVKRDADFR